MSMPKKAIGVVLVIVIILAAPFAGACAKEEASAIPPFVPPHYYECMEVSPGALLEIYFAAHGVVPDRELSDTLYKNKLFVFKDVPVTERMLAGLDEGFIRIDQITCYLVNIDDFKKFKPGDRIDVVGRNKGVNPYNTGLLFKDCIVLPAGTVALPADPDAGAISPGY